MKPQRRDFLKAASAAAMAPSLQGQGKPNILIVMADQHRAGLTRRTGFPLDTMPCLDRLAGRGVAFDRAYTTSPLCVPARVSLLTGRWPHAHRVRQNTAAESAVFEKDLFQIVRALGYKAGLTGKNHSHLTSGSVDFYRPYGAMAGWMPEPAPKEFVEFGRWIKRLNFGVAQEPTPFPLEAQFPHRIAS